MYDGRSGCREANGGEQERWRLKGDTEARAGASLKNDEKSEDGKFKGS